MPIKKKLAMSQVHVDNQYKEYDLERQLTQKTIPEIKHHLRK